MKGTTHKILGIIVFVFLYVLGVLPKIMQEYNIIISIVLVFLFSGGRVTSKKWYNWGLSPDNDHHQKAKRDWLLHSPILPLIAIILFKNPLVWTSSFAYTLHVFFDLFNPRSWGNKYTYFTVFLTTILFFVVIFK
jgi:hypothetical protein